jgi:23S rRNA (guanine2445-N2)-methyltransferase / 23S rRNA (guanine2069-N7)-methyltransferase
MRDAARGEIYTDGNYQITGRDIDPSMIDIASSNADRAGVAQLISREVGDVADVKMDTGMVITNPPYGQRLDSLDVGEVHDALLALYSDDV